MKDREQLMEAYDDAIFALLMDQYAEESGAGLLRQYQADLDAGLVPEVPDELDRRCEASIQQEFRTRRRKEWLRSFCRVLVRVVFALVYLAWLLIRTAWELLRERRLRRTHPAPEAQHTASGEDNSSIFLTP